MDKEEVKNYTEFALFLIILFGLLVTFLFVEEIDVWSFVVVIVISIIYFVALYFVAGDGKKGDFWEVWNSSHRRRVGIGIVFYIIVTAIAYFLHYRIIHYIGIFAALDALLVLMPGRVIFSGKKIWEWSNGSYVVVVVLTLVFLLANLFIISAEVLLYGTSTIVGFVFISLVAIVIIAIFLGLGGHSLDDARNIRKR